MKFSVLIYEFKDLASHRDIVKLAKKKFLEVLEYSENSVLYEIPDVECVIGQHVLLGGIIRLPQKETPFTFTGRVVSMVEDKQKQQRVCVEFIQYEKKIWQEFLAFADARQDRADHVLRTMKGED